MAQRRTDGSEQEGCNGADTFNTAASTATDNFQSHLHLQLFATETKLKVTKTQNTWVRNAARKE